MSDPQHSEQPPESNAVEELICPNCMAVVPTDANFCRKCNAPLTTLAATDPVWYIHATAHVYQKAASRPGSRIVLIGMWLLFGGLFLTNLPMAWYLIQRLTSPVYNWSGLGDSPGFFLNLYGLILGLGIEAIFAAILIKVTVNYRRGRSTSDNPQSESGEP